MCGVTFEANWLRKTCSEKCKAEKHLATMKSLWSDPEFRAHQSEATRKQMRDPKMREHLSAAMRATMLARMSAPEAKEQARASMKARMSDPEFKNRVRAGALSYWSNKENRDRKRLEGQERASSQDVVERFIQNTRSASTGGVSKPMPRPQSMLADALGPSWTTEYPVPKSGMPGNYRIDIAHLPTKTAVEVDGPSHSNPTQQARDDRKDAFLRSLGWTVLRFKNREVMRNLESITSKLRSITTTSSEAS
jgi:hypothetical protein